MFLKVANCFFFLAAQSLLIVVHQNIIRCIFLCPPLKDCLPKGWVFLTLNVLCMSIELASSITIQHFISAVNASLFSQGSNSFYTKSSKWSRAKRDLPAWFSYRSLQLLGYLFRMCVKGWEGQGVWGGHVGQWKLV